MATQFKKICQDIKNISGQLQQLEASIAASSSSPNDEHSQTRKLTVTSMLCKLDEMSSVLEKMSVKAGIIDPDRKVYGESMSKQILETYAEFKTVCERAEIVQTNLSQSFAALDAKAFEQAELAKALREKEEASRRQQQEDERRREREEREVKLAQVEREKKAEEDKKAQQAAALQAEREAYERDLEFKRVADALGTARDFRGCVRLLREHNSPGVYKASVACLRQVLFLLQAELSDPRARNIRKNNPQMTALIAAKAGASCMRALGYVDRLLHSPTTEAYLVLDEETDLDRYEEQLAFVQNCFEFIDELNES